MPRWARVAPFAHREVVATKRALAIMTGHAALSPAGRVMIQRFGRRNLSALRHTRSDLMTLIATNLLMLRVIEADPECLSKFRSPRIAAQLMTRAARRNISTVRLRPRRVASITGCVCVKSRGDR